MRLSQNLLVRCLCFTDSTSLISMWGARAEHLFRTTVDVRKQVNCSYPINNKCDRFEQKQADGCVLTNPLNATPLHPDSTYIDGFSWAIHQKIADFNSYPLRYQF